MPQSSRAGPANVVDDDEVVESGEEDDRFKIDPLELALAQAQFVPQMLGCIYPSFAEE